MNIRTSYASDMNQGQADMLHNNLREAIFKCRLAAIAVEARTPKFSDNSISYEQFLEVSKKNDALLKKINAAINGMEKLAGEIVEAMAEQ